MLRIRTLRPALSMAGLTWQDEAAVILLLNDALRALAERLRWEYGAPQDGDYGRVRGRYGDYILERDADDNLVFRGLSTFMEQVGNHLLAIYAVAALPLAFAAAGWQVELHPYNGREPTVRYQRAIGRAWIEDPEQFIAVTYDGMMILDTTALGENDAPLLMALKEELAKLGLRAEKWRGQTG